MLKADVNDRPALILTPF